MFLVFGFSACNQDVQGTKSDSATAENVYDIAIGGLQLLKMLVA